MLARTMVLEILAVAKETTGGLRATYQRLGGTLAAATSSLRTMAETVGILGIGDLKRGQSLATMPTQEMCSGIQMELFTTQAHR
jgi:hypothetical protein